MTTIDAFDTVDTVVAEIDETENVTLSWTTGLLYVNTTSRFSNGTHMIRIYATDTHGNVNATETTIFTIFSLRTEQYWVEAGANGDGTTEGSPAGNITYVLTHYGLTSDRINVKAGTYNETVGEEFPLSFIYMNTTLNATDGAAMTTIHGKTSTFGVYVSANNVTVRGFNITGCKVGIALWQANYTLVEHNILTGNQGDEGAGIGALCAHDNVIRYNVITDTVAAPGVAFVLSNNNTVLYQNTISNNEYEGVYINGTNQQLQIIENTIEGNERGIKLDRTGNLIITGNTIQNNAKEGIELFASKDTTISGNKVTNNYPGISLDSTNYTTISGNNVSYNSWNGIYLTTGSNVNTISGNIILNNTGTGITLSGSSKNTVIGNSITKNYHGIKILGCMYARIVDNTITNNTHNGIDVGGGGAANSYHRIVGNTLSLNTYEINIRGSTYNCTVLNNIITNNTERGMMLGSASFNCTIRGNSITYNSQGMFVNGTKHRIRENTLAHNAGLYGEEGLCIGNATQLRVVGNHIFNNLHAGIKLYSDAHDNIITGNNITNNGNLGIRLTGSDNNTFIGNNITNNKGDGISVSEGYNNTFIGNLIQGNGWHGLFIWNANWTVVYGNEFCENAVNAKDHGAHNQFNNSTTGNFWHDYTGWDTNGDGIGEQPYNISGTSGSKDYFPLVEPSIVVDTDDPFVSIHHPSNGTAYNSPTLWIGWQGNDTTTGIASYELQLDGGSWEDMGQNTSYEYPGLEEGSHTLRVRAIDRAGNNATATVTFTIDLSGPSVTITSPSHGQAFNSSSVTIEWTGSDAITSISYYEVYDNSSVLVYNGSDTTYTLTELSDGGYSVEVRAVDVTGNSNSTFVFFIVDLTDPTVSITSPEPDETVNEDAVAVQWTWTDQPAEVGGIDYFKVRITGGTWKNVGNDTTYTFTGLSNGEYTVDVKAFDRGGNTATDSVTFTVQIREEIGGIPVSAVIGIGVAGAIAAVAVVLYFFFVRKKKEE